MESESTAKMKPKLRSKGRRKDNKRLLMGESIENESELNARKRNIHGESKAWR